METSAKMLQKHATHFNWPQSYQSFPIWNFQTIHNVNSTVCKYVTDEYLCANFFIFSNYISVDYIPVVWLGRPVSPWPIYGLAPGWKKERKDSRMWDEESDGVREGWGESRLHWMWSCWQPRWQYCTRLKNTNSQGVNNNDFTETKTCSACICKCHGWK